MSAYLETRTYKSGFPATAFYRQNNSFEAHWHIEVELVYVCSGSITVCINKESKVLHSGELAIIRSSDIHYYDSEGLTSTIIVLIFRPELIGSPGGWPDGEQLIPSFIDSTAAKTIPSDSFSEIFKDITAEIEARPPFYQELVKGKIHELCALMLRHFGSHGGSISEKSRTLHDMRGMQAAIRFLEQNYMKELTLSDIAGAANLSQYYFSRMFSKYTGKTVQSYLAKLRTDHAERLIKTTKRTILDISLDCGFNSVRSFNRVFKSVKGYPPSRLRSPVHGTCSNNFR